MQRDRVLDIVYATYAPVCAALIVGLYQADASLTIRIVVLLLVVAGIKVSSGVLRPDGSDRMSFPSGHTSMAALLAVRSVFIALPAAPVLLAWAGIVSYQRVHSKRHRWSDVAAGWGLGIAAGIW